jgi:anti-sigma factor RsiW
MDCDEIVALTPLFLSGELDSARTSVFQAHLDSCRPCAREIQQHLDQDARLREEIRHEPMETAALDARILESIKRPRVHLPVAVAAAIAAMLVIAAVGYRVHTASPAGRILSDAAQDHHSEVIDRQPRRWVSDPSGLQALAGRAGIAPRLVDALASAGYHFDRAKMCRLGGLAFLHLVYSDGAHEFSVFLRQRDASIPDRLEHADRGPDHVASFRTPRVDAVIVTDQSREAALGLARSAARIL